MRLELTAVETAVSLRLALGGSLQEASDEPLFFFLGGGICGWGGGEGEGRRGVGGNLWVWGHKNTGASG